MRGGGQAIKHVVDGPSEEAAAAPGEGVWRPTDERGSQIDACWRRCDQQRAKDQRLQGGHHRGAHSGARLERRAPSAPSRDRLRGDSGVAEDWPSAYQQPARTGWLSACVLDGGPLPFGGTAPSGAIARWCHKTIISTDYVCSWQRARSPISTLERPDIWHGNIGTLQAERQTRHARSNCDARDQ